MKNCRLSTVDHEIPGFHPALPYSRAHLAQQGQQSFARQPLIGQCKQRYDRLGILRQSAIANLYKTKLVLHDPEGGATIARFVL